MHRAWLWILSLAAVLGLAPVARAVLTPSGDTLWNLSAGSYQIAIEVYPGSSLGTMTVVNLANGLSAVGTLYPGSVIDRPHGQNDELVADGFFQNATLFPMLGLGDPGSNTHQGEILVSLVDVDGIAFDGAQPGFSGQFLLPVDMPPLSLFESGSVAITHFEFSDAVGGFVPIVQTLPVAGVPEPSLALLATGALAYCFGAGVLGAGVLGAVRWLCFLL